MKTFFEKIRIPLIVLLSALLTIGIAAAICAIVEGDTDKRYNITENVSEITDNDEAIDVFLSFENTQTYLPENYNAEILSVTERKGKAYTEKELKTATGSITVKNYNYAHLIEDDVIRIPDSAENFRWENTDVFIFENSDGTCTAIYYKDLSRYIINDDCTITEMAERFNFVSNE